MKIQSALWPSFALTLWFVVLTGLVFPFAIYGLSQALFPHQANGRLIKNAQGQVVGSELIGQSFGRPEYFHPRPSAAGSGYDAANSSGTNLGPTSEKLINGIAADPATTDVDESYAGIKQLAETYRKENNLPLAPMNGGERGPGGEGNPPSLNTVLGRGTGGGVKGKSPPTRSRARRAASTHTSRSLTPGSKRRASPRHAACRSKR